MENILQTSIIKQKQNKTEATILTSEKKDLKLKSVQRDKEKHYIMTEGSIHQIDIQ